MELEKFDPVCAAVLKKTEIKKPAYPVIDFHMHMGKMLLGESYETKYDTKGYVRELQDAGVVYAVNMDGYFGKDLEKMQKKQEGFEEMFFNFMQLDFSAYDDPDFCDKTKKVIEDSCMRGCRGIKLWKDLSLWQRTIFRRRNIGFIFQSFQLVSELNVEQNIIFPLLLDYRKPDPAAVEEILDLLGLTERRHHLPNQLSGGQQQRVAIGRALITKPKLILADEPTGNLDSKNSQDVMALLTQASRRYQQTILMITHNKNLTASVDRVFRVSDGVLTDLGGKKNEALS